MKGNEPQPVLSQLTTDGLAALQGTRMTDLSLPASRFAEGDFRIGRALARSFRVLSRNFLIFVVVSTVALLPMYLILQAAASDPDVYARAATPEAELQAALRVLGWTGLAVVVGLVFSTLSQAIVLYGAFQDMLGRRVDLEASMRVGLRRFLPIMGVALASTLLTLLGFIALVVPGLIVFTRWAVVMPACIVDRLGVDSSLRRSAELTRGHRWKIFGMLVLLVVADLIVDNVIDQALGAVAGSIPVLAGHVIWGGIWGAFYAIFAVVLYHDLRVAKDGVDTTEIAAVFE